MVGLGALASAACDNEDGSTAPTSPPAVIETVPPDAPAGPDPPPSAPVTAPPEDEGPPVVLREDGLADNVRFGTRPDPIIVGLTLRWGPPEVDSGWLPADSPGQPYGQDCPGTQVRSVSWGRFYALFTDGPSPHGPAGQHHFFSWVYLADNPPDPRPDPGGNRPRLTTATGISVGSTVAELQAAYGDKLNLYDETTEEGLATGGPGFAAAGMFGSRTGLDPAGRVSRIVGGGGCTA